MRFKWKRTTTQNRGLLPKLEATMYDAVLYATHFLQ
jgi:hypothetical protein